MDENNIITEQKNKNTIWKVLLIFSLAIILICGVVFLFNYDIAYDDDSAGGWFPPSFGVIFLYFILSFFSICAAIILKAVYRKRVSIISLLAVAIIMPIICYWFIPQASEDLLSEEEKLQLQSTVLSAAESVREIYKDIVIADAPNYSSGINEFTNEQRKAVVEQLGKSGLVSVEEDTAMQNHEAIEAFYADYLAGQDAMVTVFEVHRDGLIGAVTFIYREGDLQTYYIGVRWKEGGTPEIQGISVSDVAEIKLTEKGYFIYAYEYVIAHASLRQYWRTKPLPEDCKELTEKYISGLSYVNYNLLVTNWDSSNVEDILMPCMYEDIYYIHTGENLHTEGWKIPAEDYEKIMTTYFPVSVETLREYCKYDESSNSYEYEMIYASPYPPFGEVVDYTENADGTITLIVDGVWPDYNSDFAFRNEIVVQPFEDGTFRYLSNSIEEKELELPPIARKD